MATVTIPREEYEELKEAAEKVKVIDNLIHHSTLENDFLALSESVAKELWDNKDDEIWDSL